MKHKRRSGLGVNDWNRGWESIQDSLKNGPVTIIKPPIKKVELERKTRS